MKLLLAAAKEPSSGISKADGVDGDLFVFLGGVASSLIGSCEEERRGRGVFDFKGRKQTRQRKGRK